MRPDAHQHGEASNSSRLHLFGRHGNTFGQSSKFKKILAFLRKHRVGRQLAPIRTLRKHSLNAEILDKEIACIHSTSIRMTGQHRPDAVLLWQFRADKAQLSGA
jgi:hypothetical protein